MAVKVAPGYRRGHGDFRQAKSKRTQKVMEKSAAQRRLAQVIANNETSINDIMCNDDDSWNHLNLQFGHHPSSKV